MRSANHLGSPAAGGHRGTPLFAIAAMAVAMLLSAVSTAAAATAIMPLGDSITDGAAGSTDDTGYRRSLYLQLDAAGYDVDFVGSLTSGIPTDFDRNHEGHGGWHANQIRDSIYNWLVATPADIVILHIGTNDVSGGDENVDEVEDILDNIDQYENDYSDTVVVFVARIILRTDSKNPQTIAFNDAVEAMVTARMATDDVYMVDMESALTYPDDMADSVHPDDIGYGKMADTWFAALDDYMGQEPLCPPGMVGYWTLDETSGSAYDDVFAGNDASCSTCPTPATGTVGGAQYFNATENDEVQIPDDGSWDWGVDDSFTIEYWMKTSSSTAGNRVIVGRDGGPTLLHWWVGCDANGTVRFQLKDVNNVGQFIGGIGPVLNDGVWHHIVAVRDDAAGRNRIYVDAALVDSSVVHDYTAGFAESVPVNLGYINLPDNYNYDGIVDELALYDVALSPGTIQEHYTEGLAGYAYCDTIPPPPVPEIENLSLTSTSGNGYTTDDLTVSFDLAGSATTAATAWNVASRAPLMALYLPMEGGEPSALADYSGNALTATKNGNPAWNATAGFDGNGAYVFDGNDDLGGGENFPAGSSYTKTAWVYRTGSGANGGNNIISGDGNTGGHAFWAPDTYGQKLSAGHNGTWNSVQDGVALALNTWYFVAVTWDDATDQMMLYKNGAVIDSATVSASVTDATVSVGSFGYANGYMWLGTIDDARIYDRALSRQQIAAMYDGGAGDAHTIVSQETEAGDDWYADVTPFSASEAGTTYTTSTLTITDETSPDCPAGMTHFWMLDETSGQPYEDSYGDADATCTSCPTNVAGTVGQAKWFNGTANEVNVSDDNTFDWGAGDSFTVEFWMNTNKSTSGNRVIVGRDDASTSLHWWVGANNSGVATFYLLDATGAGGGITAGPVLNNGAWHLITATRDGAADRNRLFVDGVKADSLSYNYGSGFGSAVPINLGFLNLGTRYRYEGALDEVALYDVALRADEIAAHYANGILGYGYCDAAPEAPVITSAPVTSGTAGQLYSYDVDATGAPAPAYALGVHPTGMEIVEATGVITWTPTEGQEGLNSVDVVATNVAGADTQSFQVDVAVLSLPACPEEMTHYWKLDDAAAPYEDYYAGNDATCTSCPDDTTGLVGRAKWFNGTDDEVNVADDGTFDWGAGDDFTVEFWMYTGESTSGNRVVVGRDDAASDLHWWIGPNDTGIATFQLRDTSGAGDAASGGSALNNSVWHHIAAVRDGAADVNRLYVDGAKVDSLFFDYASGFGGAVPINLGYLNLSAHYRYHGKLDEVALHNKALSPSEIQDHYDRGLLGQTYCEIEETPPLITSTPITDGMVGHPYTYDVDATGSPLPAYTFTTFPTGMEIVEATGAITWTPSAGQEGLNDVEVVATNSAGADTQAFQIDVAEQEMPEIENLVVTSTSGNDYNDDDLTASYDLAGTATTASTAWHKDDSPTAVLQLPMEGGAVNALLDYSGNGNDGVTSGDPEWLATGGFDGNGCFEFDGTGDKINVGAIMPQTAYTKTVWVNWDGTSGSNNILSGATAHAFWVSDYSGMRLAGGHNGAWDTVKDPALFTQDVWTFVAITFDSSVDGGKLMLYRNGALVDTATGVSAMSPADYQANVGSFANVAYFFGQIDEARIYDHALSRQQIAAMYGGGSYDPDTVVAEETTVGDDWAAHVTPFSSSEAGTTYESNTVTIAAPETPPLITSAPVTEGQVDAPYSYDVDATGYPAPTYAFNVFPTGMEIVEATGVISWTPAEGQEGLNAVEVVATNSAGSDTQAFQVDVAEAAPCPYLMAGYWRFDETSGPPYEDSLADNDATCTACPTPVAGTVGGAVQFDGSTDEVQVPDDGSFDWGADDSFTVEFWMKTGDSSPTRNRVIVGRDGGPTNLHWWIGYQTNGQARFSLNDVNNAGQYIGGKGPVVNNNAWHLFTCVRDDAAGRNRLFLDGALVDSSIVYNYTAGFAESVPMNVGYLQLDTHHYRYPGTVDELAIYDRALRQSEIAVHYTEGLAGIGYCGPDDEPPVITSSPVTEGMENRAYTYDVDATGSPAPTYAFNIFPTGMEIVEATGVITWTPTAGDIGLNDVEVVATSAAGADTQVFQVDVADEPDCPDGISHYWQFEESSQPYADTWGTNAATCTSCPTDVTGTVGQAKWFNGTANEVDVPDDDTFDWGATASFTVEFWMNTDKSTAGNRVIVGRDDAATNLHWWVGPSGTGIATFQLRDVTGAGNSITAGPVLNDGEWHLITATRDGAADKNRLFVDGAKVDSLSFDYGSGFGGPVPINLGFLNLGTRYRYEGALDEVALYDVALRENEIAAHYSNGLLGYGYCDSPAAPDAPVMDAEPEFTAGLANTVGWSDESGTGAVEYYVERATDALFTEGVEGSGWIAILSHEFASLSDGQIYHYHVKATDGSRGESGWSEAVSSTQDDSPPTTSCDDPGAYQNTLSFSLGYTASDATSGVQYVELWYQQDGGGFVQYMDGSPFTGGTIAFTAPAAGTYDFYTVGTDNVDNVEGAPGTPDCTTIVDVTPPTVANVVITNETLTNTDDFIKDTDAAQVTADVSDDDPAFAAGNIAANLTGLGGGAAEAPESYLGGVATWNLASAVCSPQDGTVTVTVSATDPAGSPATPGSDDITADNTPPTPATAFDAVPENGRCSLSWTNGADDNLEGVVVVRKATGEYPDYDAFASAYPSIDSFFPADVVDGDTVYNGTGASAVDIVAARDIYFYQAFCFDVVGLWSPADTTARDYATNYWLGDVSDVWGSWGYNGLVNDNDILKLSDSYGVANPVLPGSECDVGPTVHPDDSRLGVPRPDDQVEYEDLMIFAMNYGQVMRGRITAPLLAGGSVGSELTLSLRRCEAPPAGDVVFALRLDGNADEVKGVSVRILFDAPGLDFVSAELAEMAASAVAPVFFWHSAEDGVVKVDLAVLGSGTTLGGSGDLVELRFRSASGDGSVRFESADLRGMDNGRLEVTLDGHEGEEGLPVALRLFQNMPNPFNPVTTLRYDMPQAAPVAIRVYDVAGRLVRTLVDGPAPAGHNQVIWDGTTDSGAELGSGVYFCTMESGAFSASGKMLLLK